MQLLLFLPKHFAYLAERLFFSLFRQNAKQSFYFIRCFGVYKTCFFRFQKILKRMRVCVFISLIYFACRNPVTKHLCNIFLGHRNRLYFMRNRVIVCPIFKVMSVSALMVQPRGRISVLAALFLIWAFISAVIPCSAQKFGRAVLR